MESQTVLIADDELATLILLQSMLEITGYTIFTAAHGREALEIALTVRPDIILSDVMMPEMDGFELCQQLQKHPETQNIPVLLITSLTELALIFKGFQKGACGYIPKPLDNDEVLTRVASTLKQKQLELLPANAESLAEKTSLIEALRLCEREQLNGVIYVTHLGQTGTIQLTNGEVTTVKIMNILSRVRLEKLLLWQWKDGYFTIEEREVAQDRAEAHEPQAASVTFRLKSLTRQADGVLPAREQPTEQAATMPNPANLAAAAAAAAESTIQRPRKEVTSMATKTEQLKDVMNAVRTELPDAEISIVASDGTMFASTVTGSEATRIGAMISTIIGLSRKACQALKRGEASEALLKGSEGFIAIYPAGNKANLGVTTKTDINLGMLNLVGREAADKIQAILD